MNAKHILVFGAALVAVSTSFAGDTNYPELPAPVSTMSRAEVTAALNAARADRSLTASETTYPGASSSSGMGRTRQEVITELQQYRAQQHPILGSNVGYPEEFQSSSEQARLAAMKMPSGIR
jgi:hypothetical protein